MKIVDYTTHVVGAGWRELVFVELVTDDGIRGVGEVRMMNKTRSLLACLEELVPRHVIGSSPFDVQRLAWDFQRKEYGRPGEVTSSALSVVDIACYDIMGKALEVPVWKLLGGRYRDRVPAYANGWYRTRTEPDAFAELALEVVKRGYTGLKVDPFGPAVDELERDAFVLSVEIVAAVREAIGDGAKLMIEMHGRFTPSQAAGLAQALEPYRPEWLEEPVPPENASALRRVRDATVTPIATGERIYHLPEAREFITEGCVDIFQQDITHFGGFTAMRDLAAWLRPYYAVIAPHNVCGPVATAANVHLGVSTPNYKVLEHFNDFADPWVQDLVDTPPVVDAEDGCFALPTEPGLGVSLDVAACERHPSEGSWFNLYEAGWELRRHAAEPVDGASEDRG